MRRRIEPKAKPAEVYSGIAIPVRRLGNLSEQSPTTEESDEVEDIENLVESQDVTWHAGRDSNLRPSGSKPLSILFQRCPLVSVYVQTRGLT